MNNIIISIIERTINEMLQNYLEYNFKSYNNYSILQSRFYGISEFQVLKTLQRTYKLKLPLFARFIVDPFNKMIKMYSLHALRYAHNIHSTAASVMKIPSAYQLGQSSIGLLSAD